MAELLGQVRGFYGLEENYGYEATATWITSDSIGRSATLEEDKLEPGSR